MFRTHAHRSMDMTEGPLFSKVLFFALPIMISGILQLAFNAADTIVVGRYAGSEALAAVGSVGSLNGLIISMFIGLSVGVNVLVARYTGAQESQLDMIRRIDRNAPPMFLVATAEDMLTNFGTLPLINAYARQGLKYEAHIFQHGPHGYALADVTTADGSSQVINDAYAAWLDLSVSWIRKVYGEPKLVDKSTSKMAGYLKELGITMPGAEKSADFA